MSQSIAIIPTPPPTASQAYRDWLGVAASVLCAIHCAAMPFVVGFLPLLGLSFLADPAFHKWMVGICLLLALLAFVPGWRRHHRLAPAIIGVLGLGLITFAAFAGPEDCCPTPCDANPTTSDPAGVAMVSNDPASCDAACCDDEAPVVTASKTLMATSPGVEDEAVCASSCCSNTDTATAVASVAPTAPAEGDAACSAACCAEPEMVATAMTTDGPIAPTSSTETTTCDAACCPTDEGTVLAGSSNGFMDLVWLLMTPIGGVILVAAHLTNHRLGCLCKSDRCRHASPDHAA